MKKEKKVGRCHKRNYRNKYIYVFVISKKISIKGFEIKKFRQTNFRYELLSILLMESVKIFIGRCSPCTEPIHTV
ncbi:hypothetical protein [Persephonella sp.]